MNDVLDAIVNYEALPAPQREALLKALAEEPELAHLFIRWQEIQGQVRDSLEANLPDRSLLVLYALSLKNEEYLSDAERSLLADSRESLERALNLHPALNDVIKDIQQAESDFQDQWRSHFTPSTSRIHSDRPPARPNRRTPAPQRLNRIVSLFAVLALVTGALYASWQWQFIETIRTGEGEFKIVQLADGSTVRLSGASKMTFRKTDRTAGFDRAVNLKGHAFFDIAPSSEHFVVETPTALTAATGTRFSLDANRSLTEVVLTSGTISVDSRKRPGHPVVLSPGQITRITRREAPSTPEIVANLTERLSWTGLMVFHQSPMSSVSAHIRDQFGVDFSVSPALQDQEFYGTFDTDTLSVDELLGAITVALDAELIHTSDSTYLLQKPAPSR